MPKRHGIKFEDRKAPKCLLGIWRVFDPWIDPHILASQGFVIRHRDERPSFVEYHFRRSAARLLRSLTRLYHTAREYDKFLEDGGLMSQHPGKFFDIQEDIGISADSVFHYVNFITDDIARITPYCLDYTGKKHMNVDGFSDLKTKIEKNKISTPAKMKDMFISLEDHESWWTMALKRGIGIRQRLTHYTDLVLLSGASNSDDNKLRGKISMGSVGGPVHVEEFEKFLSDFFLKYFSWLDEMENLLKCQVSASLEELKVEWATIEEPIPAMGLEDMSTDRLNDETYLYLPKCIT